MPQEAFSIFDQLDAATAPKSAFDIFDKIAPSRESMEKNAPGVLKPVPSELQGPPPVDRSKPPKGTEDSWGSKVERALFSGDYGSLVPAAKDEVLPPLKADATDEEAENHAAEMARGHLDQIGRGVARFALNLANVKNGAIAGATLGAGTLLPALANTPAVAEALKDAPKVLKALDVASRAAVPATGAAVGAAGLVKNGVPKNLEQATEAALNLLLTGAGAAGAIKAGKGVLENYPELPTASARNPVTGEAIPAESVGGEASVNPQQASAAAQSLGAAGQRLAAQYWKNLNVKSPTEIATDAGKAYLQPFDPSAKTPFHEVLDASGKRLVGGTAKTVGDWLRTHTQSVTTGESTSSTIIGGPEGPIRTEISTPGIANTSENAPAGQHSTAPQEEGGMQFERRQAVPADVKTDAIFHDKNGRVFTVKEVSPTGQVIFHGEDGQERVANSPEQFAKRMKGVATPGGPQSTETSPVTPVPEQVSTPGQQTFSAFDQVQPEAAAPTPVEAPATQVATGGPAPVPALELPVVPKTEQGEGNALHVDKLEKAAEAEAPPPAPVESAPVATTPAETTTVPEIAPAPAPPVAPEEAHLPYKQTAAESGMSPLEHRAEVKDALARGEAVPDHVLQEYPDLRPGAESSAEKSAKPEAVADVEEGPLKWDAPEPAKQLAGAIEAAKLAKDDAALKFLEKLQSTAGRRQVESADMDRVQEIIRGAAAEPERSKESHEMLAADFIGNGEFGGSSLSRLKPAELVNLAQRNNVPFKAYKSKPTRENRNKLERAIMHEGNVRDALRTGKTVPPEVLAQYPHLQPGAPGLGGAVKKSSWEGSPSPDWWKGIAATHATPATWKEVRDGYVARSGRDPDFHQTMKDYAQDYLDKRADAGRDRESVAVDKKIGGKMSSQAGQAPILSDLIGWVDKKFGKKAPKVNYTGLGGAEPEEQRLYSKKGAFKSTFAPGGNLSQVRLASIEAWRALVKMASADSVSRATLRVAELQIHEALKGAPIGFEDLIKYYSESRLRGIRDRWEDFADQAQDMSDAELEQSFNDAFGNLLESIQNKRGIPINVRQTAQAIASRKDWATLRDFLADTFTDASSLVSRLMDDKEFSKIHGLVANDIQVARADNIYGRSIEKLMSDYHAEHEGVFSNALGPADRYVPLTGNKPPDLDAKDAGKKNLYARASKAFKSPPNIQNVMATGISPHGYDTTITALEKGLMKAVRASSKYQAVEAMEKAGLLKQYTGQAPQFFDFHGKRYPAKKYEIQSARPLVTIQDGVKKVVHLPAKTAVMPKWVYDEAKHVLDAQGQMDDEEVMREIFKFIQGVNQLAIIGPNLALIDSYNILNTLTANTPALGKTPGMIAASAPMAKRLAAAILIAREEPGSVESMDEIIEMAKVGAIPTKFASKTWSKRVAALTGADMAGKLDSSPWLYGPDGVDIRGRLQMFRIAKAFRPDATPEELHDFINQIGTYVPGLQSTVERWLKYTGVAPFYTRGAQMLINGLHSISGTGPLRGAPKGSSTATKVAYRVGALLTGSALTIIAFWLTTSYLAGMRPTGLLTSEMPKGAISDEMRNSKLGHQLGWDKPGVISQDFAVFNPMMSRGLRATGALAAIDTMMHGGTWWQGAEYGLAQSASTVTQPAVGPIMRSAWVGITGTQPYLTAGRDQRGSIGPQFFPAIPPRSAGVKSFSARAIQAAASTNAMESQLGQVTGFLSPIPDNTPSHFHSGMSAKEMALAPFEAVRDSRALEMILNIAAPGVNPKPVNEFSKQKMLYQQRSGTK